MFTRDVAPGDEPAPRAGPTAAMQCAVLVKQMVDSTELKGPWAYRSGLCSASMHVQLTVRVVGPTERLLVAACGRDVEPRSESSVIAQHCRDSSSDGDEKEDHVMVINDSIK